MIPVAVLAGVLLAAAVVGVVVVVANSGKSKTAGPLVTPGTPTTVPLGPVDAGTQLQSDRGVVVYSDNFTDPGSGWPLAPALADAGTTYMFGVGGYLIHGHGDIHHFAYPSYDVPIPQLGATTTASQTAGASGSSGFGVACSRGHSTANIRYEFLLLTDLRWFLERGNGEGTTPLILKQGTSPAGPGTAPVTVTGMCATETDGQTNRLAMFVNGTSVVDLTDNAVGMADKGWQAGVMVASRATVSSTVTFTNFTERDLSR